AVASADLLTGEAPLDVAFTGSASTDDSAIVSYLWDFGDGNTANTADAAHTYSTEGTYDVTLTVTDAEDLTGVANLSIEVTPDLPPTLAVTPDPLDFGLAEINGAAVQLDLDALNQGSPGEIISITAINITGTDAAMFGHSAALPLD
uniref:PKD domain-containing protein n=1 Tax=Eudoraea algarum TaxID=3417568 RepID=UPI003F5D54E0